MGSNLSYRRQQLRQACEYITRECGSIIRSSAIYETAPWGKYDQPSFLNQALEIETELEAIQLLEHLLSIENKLGRERREKYGARLIDIDILFFNNEIHHSPSLELPHPEIQNRRFALMPLAEIAPELVHPILNKTIIQLLKECKDELEVKQAE